MKPLFLALAALVVIAIGSAAVLTGLDASYNETRIAAGVRLN